MTGDRLIPCPSDVQPCEPHLAEVWLGRWQKVGGGITVARDGSLNPWLLNTPGGPVAENLFNEIAESPALARAVRIVLRSRRKRGTMGATA